MTTAHLGQTPTGSSTWDQVIGAGAVLLVAVVCYLVARGVLLPIILRWTKKTRTIWDDLLLDRQVLNRVALLAPFVAIYLLIGGTASLPASVLRYVPQIWQQQSDLGDTWWAPVARINAAIIVLLITLVASSLINAFNNLYRTFTISRQKPLKGYLQIAKLVMIVFGGVIVIAIVTNQPVGYFVTGLGAIAAVLLLVFKDTLLSLVASVQLTQNDMVRVGDWIEIPGQNVDGDVVDVALHTVKVRNWDKTIATVPTTQLIQNSFKNWRGMAEARGRRIKRSINIDMATIRFLTDEEVARFSRFVPLKAYIESKRHEIEQHNRERDPGPAMDLDQRRLTNVGTLRAYIIQYLKSHPKLHQEGLTMLVRQLQPTSQGLPIELYCFSNDISWANYESIQADIFDHLLAMLPEFSLRVFQEPSSSDFQAMVGGGKRADS